jgi:hypothetical protein
VQPLELALSLATTNSWPVFPCRPADDFDPETGEVLPEKAPLISNGFRGATLNERVIKELWKRNPDAIVGIPTGERIGAWVLDLDLKTNANGRDWLAAMESEHEPLPDTYRVATANGGEHIYFNHAPGVRNRGKLGAGVDVRGEGGFVIAAGSVMGDDRAYTALNDHPIADAPQWLLDLVLPPVATHTSSTFSYQPGNNDRYINRAVEAELNELAGTPPGNRGYQLNASAFALGQFVGAGALSRDEAEHGLWGAAVSCGVAQKDGERETRAKIRRGLEAGMRQPRHIPQPEYQSQDNTRLVDISRMIENGKRKADRQRQEEESTIVDANANSVQDSEHPERGESAPESFQTEENDPIGAATQPVANDNDLPSAEQQAKQAPPPHSELQIRDWTASRFVGEPEPVEWLVDGVIERGLPSMIAAMGEVGKSFALLELSRRVAFGSKRGLLRNPIFGGEVVAEGTAVFITGEDDARSIHRRLNSLDPKGARFAERGDKLIVVPLPSAVGAVKPFWKDDRKNGPSETDEWKRLVEQLIAIDDLVCLTIDPLQLFAALQINEDPAAGQFVCGSFSTLAAHTGANVFFSHHMAKRAKDIVTLADARDSVRGSSALVDGVRLAYGLWYPPADKARQVCKDIGQKYEPNKIVCGGVIKANGQADRSIATYCRSEHGLLVDITAKRGTSEIPEGDLITALVEAVRVAAAAGSPLTKTGAAGIHENRETLPDEIRNQSRNKLHYLVDRALEKGYIVKAKAPREKTPKWLDVPTGLFAMGLGEFRAGMARTG